MNLLTYRLLYRFFVLALLSQLFLVIAFAQNSKPTLDEIVNALEQKNNNFQQESQFEIQYSRYACEDVLKSQYSGGDLLVDWEIAKKKSSWVVKRTLSLPKTSIDTSSDTTKYPEIEYFLLLNGKFCDYHLTNEICNIDDAKEVISNLFDHLIYFDFLGMNIYQKIAESNGVDYIDLQKKQIDGSLLLNIFFPEGLTQNRDSVSISDTVENIDGNNCFRVEYAGREVLWVDVKNLSIIRKRVSYFKKDLPIKYVVSFNDYKEIKSGIFLPFSFNVDYYAHIEAEPKTSWGKVAKRQKYKVSKISFDDIPNARFDISPTIGTNISDALRKENYRVSNPDSDPFAGSIAQGIKANRFFMFRALFIITGSILILLAVWFKFRKRNF